MAESKPVIRSMGLWWDCRLVQWRGDPGPEGQPFKILGVSRARAKREYCVDFFDQNGFYALHDDAERLVYVGQTGSGRQRLGKRLSQHLTDSLMGRWRFFSWFGLREVLGSNKLKADTIHYHTDDIGKILDPIEVMLIHLTEPRLNRSWGNQKKHGINRYYQFGRFDSWLGLPSGDDDETSEDEDDD